MDPTHKRKVGSLLDALEAVSNRFNLRQLENEIAELLSPTATVQKKESPDEASISKYDPGFSFVRHQQNFIPGLSIPQEPAPQLSAFDRGGFGDGKLQPRIMPGITFEVKEKPKTDAFRSYGSFRGRGGNFSAPKRFDKFRTDVKEEIPSTSSASSDRPPKPAPSPFAERIVDRKGRSSQEDDRDPRSSHTAQDTEDTHDRKLDEPNRGFHQRRESFNSEKRYHNRGGTSSNNRGYENQGRGVMAGIRPGWHDNRGGRGFSGNRGHDNRGMAPSGSNRGQDNRGRPFNNYRGPNNRGQGNDNRGGGGRGRGRRGRDKMSQEELEKAAAERERKTAEIKKQIRLRAGLPAEDEDENK